VKTRLGFRWAMRRERGLRRRPPLAIAAGSRTHGALDPNGHTEGNVGWEIEPKSSAMRRAPRSAPHQSPARDESASRLGESEDPDRA